MKSAALLAGLAAVVVIVSLLANCTGDANDSSSSPTPTARLTPFPGAEDAEAGWVRNLCAAVDARRTASPSAAWAFDPNRSLSERKELALFAWPRRVEANLLAADGLTRLDPPEGTDAFQDQLRLLLLTDAEVYREGVAALDVLFSEEGAAVAWNRDVALPRLRAESASFYAAWMQVPVATRQQIMERLGCLQLQLLLITAVGHGYQVYSSSEPPSPAALQYYELAISTIRTNALFAARVDWDAVRAEGMKIIAGAQTPAETYVAVQLAVAALRDRHSSFSYAPVFSSPQSATGASVPIWQPEGLALTERIGYVWVPGASAGPDSYATTLHNRIGEIGALSPCGRVVDLRSNTGGNMWPMLAGLGPLLGEGELGFFIGPGRPTMLWSYRQGQSFTGEIAWSRTTGPVHTLERLPPVAVLTTVRPPAPAKRPRSLSSVGPTLASSAPRRWVCPLR
jgi:hypothetical protein